MQAIRRIKVGDLEFDCREAGDQKNQAIILLHGFPETSIMWIRLMDKLATLGF